MATVKFSGKVKDDFGRPQYTFEAKVEGFEHSLIAFALDGRGNLVMHTKYFRELPRRTQSKLLVLARTQMRHI